MLIKKTVCGFRLFILVVMLGVVLSCASPKATGPEPEPSKQTQEMPTTGKAEPVTIQKSTQPAPEPPKQIQGMQIIGEVEPVTILEAGLTLPARIDTGATTSSLDARDIQQFERDGKKWVRFVVVERRSGKKVKVEGRLTRSVEITRHGADPQVRPVVKLKAILGKVELLREFSLTNRSTFTYPVLIGRNFLQGKFLVDVTRKNTTSPMSEKAK